MKCEICRQDLPEPPGQLSSLIEITCPVCGTKTVGILHAAPPANAVAPYWVDIWILWQSGRPTVQEVRVARLLFPELRNRSITALIDEQTAKFFVGRKLSGYDLDLLVAEAAAKGLRVRLARAG